LSNTGIEILSDPVDGLIWVVKLHNILLIIQFRDPGGRGGCLKEVIE